jgi:hypothetical protein
MKERITRKAWKEGNKRTSLTEVCMVIILKSGTKVYHREVRKCFQER